MIFSGVKAITIPEGNVKSIAVGGVTIWKKQASYNDIYQRLESFYTSGGAYFLTDFIANNTSGMELTASFPSYADVVPMGSRVDADSTRFFVPYLYASSRSYFGWNSAPSLTVSPKTNTIYIARLNYLNERKARLLNASATSLASANISGTLTPQTCVVGILAYLRASDNYVGGRRTMTFYSAKITQDSEIVREYVPCYRKSDGAVGLYEKYTEQFLEKLGTNTITIGAEIEWQD